LDASDDPGPIVSAILEIDRMLTIDAEVKGESRGEGRRIVFSPPLGVIFEVDWLTYEVTIGEAWGFRRHDRA